MDFLPDNISEYAEKHTQNESELLQKLNRETYAKVIMPRMLSGHLQGRLLSMISKMIRPSSILEIGTFTGYSAICLAEGLPEHGKIISIDINEELEFWVLEYWEKAGLANKAILKIGNALEIVPKLNEEFDLVFIDADKDNYSNYFDIVIDKVKSGGFILADNVLWSGKVANKPETFDRDTKAIDDFNKKIFNDSRVENILLPIRDGVMIIRKL